MPTEIKCMACYGEYFEYDNRKKEELHKTKKIQIIKEQIQHNLKLSENDESGCSSYYNINARLRTELDLIENDIDFKHISSGIIQIIHKDTNEEIKFSLKNQKMFYQNSWSDTKISNIIDWYKSSSGNFKNKTCPKCKMICSIVGNNYAICKNKKCDQKWVK
jgi:hypothetical protein